MRRAPRRGRQQDRRHRNEDRGCTERRRQRRPPSRSPAVPSSRFPLLPHPHRTRPREHLSSPRRFAIGLIRSHSHSVAAALRKLQRNTHLVFDYLELTSNTLPPPRNHATLGGRTNWPCPDPALASVQRPPVADRLSCSTSICIRRPVARRHGDSGPGCRCALARARGRVGRAPGAVTEFDRQAPCRAKPTGRLYSRVHLTHPLPLPIVD